MTLPRAVRSNGVRELLQAVAVGSSADSTEEDRNIAGWRCALCLEILNRFLKSCEVSHGKPRWSLCMHAGRRSCLTTLEGTGREFAAV